jgi:hypothetical protein
MYFRVQETPQGHVYRKGLKAFMLLVKLEYVTLVSCPLGRRPPGVINFIIIITDFGPASTSSRQFDTDDQDESEEAKAGWLRSGLKEWSDYWIFIDEP